MVHPLEVINEITGEMYEEEVEVDIIELAEEAMKEFSELSQ